MSDYMKDTARFEFTRDPENGMLFGPDGCHHDTEAEAMYFGQISLCGCGNPEEVHQFLIDCLCARRDDNENILDHKKVAEIVKSRPETVAEFVLHFLHDRNLTEHGGSVYWSWTTERGKQLVEAGALHDA